MNETPPTTDDFRRVRKVLLVLPHGADPSLGMPLSLAYLKSNTDSEKYNIELLDCSLGNIKAGSPELLRRIQISKPDVVGISTWSITFPEALKVLRIVKNDDPGVKTVLGGPHASAVGDMALAHQEIDYLFKGEAELVFGKFLDELNKGEIDSRDLSGIDGLSYRTSGGSIISNKISWIPNLDDIKLPDYQFVDIDGYIRNGYRQVNTKKRCAPIMATRGCPYICGFCSAPIIAGRKIRRHSIEYLIDWLQTLYRKHDIRGFSLIDDNFTFYPEYAKEFCREVIKLGYKDIEISTSNGIRMQRGDMELWKLMKRAGWKMVIVAPESGSENVLKLMHKKLDPSIIPGVIKDIKDAGLKVQGFFIAGYPGETLEDLQKTANLIKTADFDIISLSNFQPLPGTPIYNELVEKNEVTGDLQHHFPNKPKRSYTPQGLKGFNFSFFYVKLLLFLFFRNPLNFIFILRLRKPTEAFSIFFSHVLAFIRHGLSFSKTFKPGSHTSL